MGHPADEEYLVKENIDEYLNALAQRIKEAGIGKHRIPFRYLARERKNDR